MSTAEERMQDAIEELEQENRLLRARNTRLEAEANAAPVQEPVAWEQELANILCRIHRDGGHYVAEHGWRKAIDDADLKVAQLNAAFDTTTPAAPVQEPLTDSFVQLVPDKCDRIVWRGSYHHLPPAAQRQWVGLTDEEIETQVSYNCTLEDMARSVEAKLKEKNS